MKRLLVTILAAAALLAPRAAHTQEDAATRSYRAQREILTREIDQLQQRLADLRSQRVTLQARIETVIAQMMQQRAQQLLMSNEQTALQQLDAILTASQDNLLAQRDRFSSLGDAVRRRAGSALVVMLRADSTAQAQQIGQATLTVDNVQVDSRNYSVAANEALRIGAVDQLYRADVLPTAHTVTLQIVANGQTLSQTVSLTASTETVSYVQFAVRNGQLVATTWTSRGTTPF